jgi:exodeoxyribonuclease VII small subunit
MTTKPVADLTFEEALKELEGVVGKLERGDVALEDSIALYERGAALKSACERKLSAAEERISKITLGPDNAPVDLVPLDNP